VRIFNKSTLSEFWKKHKDAEESLKTWYKNASKTEWKKPRDVKKMFAKASIVANNRVVFDINGGSYRLVVEFNYDFGLGYIRFIGTHSDYDKIDVSTC